MTLTRILLEEAETTYATAERLFLRVTNAELSWRPAQGSNWMTMGQLLMHCAAYGCGKAIQGFVRGDWGLPENKEAGNSDADLHVPPAEALPAFESVDQALELLAQDRKLALTCIADSNEADLLTRRLTAPRGGPETPLFQHLLRMIEHLAQHKGQLFYYLKLMGKDVRTSNLWGV